MADMLPISKYTIGVGDRFAQQGKAQLQACVLAQNAGVEVIPVWNKSNREHVIIGSEPASTRAAADKAVQELNWRKPHHVDADHIGLKTVDRFVSSSDFFTIDVADFIGTPPRSGEVASFVKHHRELAGNLSVPGIEKSFTTTREQIEQIAGKYLSAISEAGKIYRHLAEAKKEPFITEISMDETDQ